MSQEKTKTTIHNNINIHPCFAEQQFAYKCMSDNDYDREKCMHAFWNFRDCKRFWGAVKNKRLRLNIKPSVPTPEERNQIIEHLGKDLPYEHLNA